MYICAYIPSLSSIGKGAKPDFLRNKDDVEDSAVGGQFDVAVDHDQSNQEHKLNKVKSKKRQNKVCHLSALGALIVNSSQ